MRYTAIKSIALVIYLFICPSAATVSHAYILTGSHLLRMMTQQLGRGQGLLINQKHIVYDERLPQGSIELNETLQYLFPDKFRSDLRSESTHRIHIISKGTGVTVIDGKVAAQAETKFDRYIDLLLYRHAQLLEERLALLDVDIKHSSLGRFNGRLGFVVGSEYPDESPPQLWIDKETFRPFRWIVLGRKSGDRGIEFEVRYLNWQKVENIWYPMEITVFENDILIRELKVKSIKISSNFANGSFSKQRLRFESQPAFSDDHQEILPQAEDEVKKTIEEFKKLYNPD